MGAETTTEVDRGSSTKELSRKEASELIERYEKLVYKIAHRLQKNLPEQVEIEDLVGWGYTGLLEAYHRYDESKATRFASYAYYRVRGAMLDACPAPMVDPHRRVVEQGCNEILNTFAHVVNNRDGGTGVEDRLSMLSDVAGSLMMVFVLGDHPERALRPDAAPHEQKIRRRETAQKMRELLEKLPENEREVLVGVYFDEETLTGIADRLDLSPSWVSRIHSRALKRMRRMIDGDDELAQMRHAVPI